MLTTYQRIVKEIILAQVASDAGKSKYMFDSYTDFSNDQEAKEAENLGYGVKDAHILKAVNMICRNHTRDIRFYVCKDVQRKTNTIVYFDIRFEEMWYQVSFHSFGRAFKKFYRGSETSKTSWMCNQDSRSNCMLLGEKLNLFSNIEID